MASHSAFPQVIHHQHGAHLPPPPTNVGQTLNQRLPSLRSLNFHYPPVGEPGSTTIEGPSQPQPRGEQSARVPFAQQEEYYHQREIPYYQDAASSPAHQNPAQTSAKRTRSASNLGQRSPYAVQAHHGHSHNNTSNAYPNQPNPHAATARASVSTSGYNQGHTQATQQGHTYAPGHQHPDPGHATSPFFNRLSQPWYYSTGHQPPQQNISQQQHPPQTSSVQQPQHPHHQHQHQPPQPQQQVQQPQNAAQKHTLSFQQYSAPATSPHSPHQAQGQAPPQPPRGSAPSFPTQPLQAPPQVQAHSTSESSPTLAGPGSAPATTNTTFGSPQTPGFSASGSGIGTGSARAVDAKALGEDAERAAASGMHLSKRLDPRADAFQQITEHSSVLCEFANRYGQLPHLRPSPNEVAEMAQRATLVLQLVEHLRRVASAAGTLQPSPIASFSLPSMGERDREKDKESADEKTARAGSKKRPWEDATVPQGSGEDARADRSGEENTIPSTSFELKDMNTTIRSVADQDMAIIRSKRGQGSGAAGGAPGAPKAKYRKRSRATPPGKCHSCNIKETPEWRRGPDGARTLCNACGLHYAKLLRKRDKTIGAGGDANATPIDLEMLRQSSRVGSEPTPPKADSTYRDDMSEIQLQPVRTMAPQMGVAMQVHQWTPPGVPRDESGYELGAYSTSLMRSSNARGSPA